ADLQPAGRPAINSALVMTLDGAALLVIDARTARGRRPAELLAGIAVLVTFAAIIGYMYGVRGLYSFGPQGGMALLTAIVLSVLSFAVLFAPPDDAVACLVRAGGA